MTTHNIGAVLIVDHDKKLQGIISERDIVHAIAKSGASILSCPVSDIMSKQLITCMPHDNINKIMNIISQNRIRHLPVVNDKEQLIGIVSIGDVVKRCISEAILEADELKRYIRAN